MQNLPTANNPSLRVPLLLTGVVLIIALTLAGVELYRVANPQHYYYGYPMAIEQIGALNNGAYCVALDPYNRMCFSTEAEMMDYSNRRMELREAVTAP